MANNGPFGFDPEDLDRIVREAGEGLRDAFGKGGLGVFFDQATGGRRPRPEPETAGETGDGVWAIFTTGENGGATVEQVYASELDALRANKHNTDANRKVRFLPYGIGVSVLDASSEPDDDTLRG
jgi:hypothetical protein